MCLGIPAEILDISQGDDAVHRVGTVQFGYLKKQVNLACVPEARVGDHVLVHAGIAIGCLQPEAVAPLQAALESLVEPESTT